MPIPGSSPALAYIAARRESIFSTLREVAATRGGQLEAGQAGGAELLATLLEYAGRGKMLRGALVHLGAELFAGRGPRPGVPEAAAAMELFQAGLLVHDDIMDRDELRRGAPSVHSRFAAEARASGAPDSLHLGEALAICAGDLCYFEGYRLLSSALEASSLGPAARGDLLSTVSSELSVVALAQMRDCRWGSLPLEPTEDEIVGMYRGKTARYTFSLPLVVGASLGGGEASVALLREIGESAGLAFQLRDDELGLFGDPELLGKPVGSDLRENKKTVLRARLFARASADERSRLLSVFGSDKAGPAEVALVRELAEKLGVRASLSAWMTELAGRARAGIAGLTGVEPGARALLLDLVDWLVTRQA